MSVKVQAQSTPLDKIVVKVNSSAIVETEIERRIRFMKFEQGEGASIDEDTLRQRATEDSINVQLYRQQLVANGFSITFAEVEERLVELSSQNGLTVEEFINQFAAFDVRREDVELFIVDALVDERITENILIPRVAIREVEIDRYIEVNQHIFLPTVEYNLHLTVVKLDCARTAAEENELRNYSNVIKRELEAGADFVDLGRVVSKLQCIDHGSLGWLRAENIAPELIQAISANKNLQTLGPIPADGSEVFMKIQDKRLIPAVELPQVQQFLYSIIVQSAQNEAGVAVIEEQMESIRKNVLEGADFAGLAKFNSHDSQTRKKGGDLGWLPADNIPSEHLRVLINMRPGSVSDLIRVQNSLFLLHLRDVRMADSEERKRSYVRNLLRNHKLNSERLRNLDQLRARADIEYRRQY